MNDLGQQAPVVLTLLVGFAGVIMLLQPTLEQNQLGAGVIGLLSGLLSAVATSRSRPWGALESQKPERCFTFLWGPQ